MKEKPSHSVFLSYSTKDAEIAKTLYRWLVEVAGLTVWIDQKEIAPGSNIAKTIRDDLPKCRNFIALISENWTASEWCPGEWADAVEHRKCNPGFEMIAIQIDESRAPTNLQQSKLIHAPGGNFRTADAAALLSILTDAVYDSNIAGKKDIYLSYPWRGQGRGLSHYVIQQLMDSGFRPVGDAEDQTHFDPEVRVRRIMESCGAIAVVFPNRGAGHTSSFIIDEAQKAIELGIPLLPIADQECIELSQSCADGPRPETVIPETIAKYCIRVDQESYNDPLNPDKDMVFEITLADRLDDLHRQWKKPGSPHQMFLASNLNPEWQDQKNTGAKVISNTLASQCIVGDGITGDGAQKQIISMIQSSVAIVADISDDCLNTCIEAGIARGSKGPVLHLIARGERRPTDIFMFKDMEVSYYRDELEYIGVLHRIAREYRRSVVTID